MIRILLIFFVITAVLSIIRGFLSSSSSTPNPRAGNDPVRPATPNRLVKDPVCGTYVAEQSAIRAGEHFFCSNECRSKYLAG